MELQEKIDRHLATGMTAVELAQEAGISPATLSKIRTGKYAGNVDRVSARLLEAMASREAADAIATGRYRPAWLVRTRKELRVVKRPETVERMRQRDPEAHVVQVWLGPEPQDMYFVKM